MGQLAFLLSGSVPTILLARMLSGLFAAGTTVNFMAYIADVSPAGQLGRNMSVCAAVTSAGTAAGYLVGGVIGDLSVHGTFLAQIAILCTVAAGIGLLLRDGPAYQKQPLALKRAANPFSCLLYTSCLCYDNPQDRRRNEYGTANQIDCQRPGRYIAA